MNRNAYPGWVRRPPQYREASQVVLVVKNPPASAGDRRDVGSIPGSGGSPGGGHGIPLQYSCLENPMDRGAWQATVHSVAESQTWLNRLSTHRIGRASGPSKKGFLPFISTHSCSGAFLSSSSLLISHFLSAAWTDTVVQKRTKKGFIWFLKREGKRRQNDPSGFSLYVCTRKVLEIHSLSWGRMGPYQFCPGTHTLDLPVTAFLAQPLFLGDG